MKKRRLITGEIQYVPEMKIDKFANSVDHDHYEPPHLDLHCLPSSLRILNMIYILDLTFFENLQTKILLSAFW